MPPRRVVGAAVAAANVSGRRIQRAVEVVGAGIMMAVFVALALFA
jgi:hypothetical protein